MVAKLTAAELLELDELSNLEEEIIYLCQKFETAQNAYNAAFPQAKRRVMELHSDFLSKSVVVQFAFPLESDTFTPETVGEIFPSEVEPPVPIIPSALGKVYTASQSSTYGALAATYANLTDGDGSTGGGCNSTQTEWIQATFGEVVSVASITVGGGSIPAWGAVASYLNGAKLQYSLDGVIWTTVWTVAGVTDSGATQFVTYALPTPIEARYWRLYEKPFLITTEFKFA